MKSLIALSLILITTMVLAEGYEPVKTNNTWRVEWKNNNGKKGIVIWKVQEWEDCCGVMNMSMSGKAKDSFGTSNVSGGCAEGSCSFEQTYISGKYKGKTYVYIATYELTLSDEKPDLSANLKTIKGRYGLRDKKPHGTFTINRPI